MPLKFALLCLCYASIVCITLSSDSFQQRPWNKDPTQTWGRPMDHTYELPHAVNDDRCRDDLFEDREVITNFGRVKGKTVSLCDGPNVGLRQRPGEEDAYLRGVSRINVYLGIPYAEPPTKENNLQFKPPRYPRPWNTISALNYKPSCPQNAKYLGLDNGINRTHEDCLYLNIFSPDGNNLKSYPVMIYIHGGNWDHGSSNLFPPHMLAASQEVVVVTFNYRLGHLGFLSTGDDVSVGNYGLKDQMLAIKWVYENIRYFKGDPDAITLFGSEAGAAAASLIAMSPLSRHMVKRVIALNGSPVADWAAIVDPLFVFNTSRVLGEHLGCTTEDSYRLVECIKQRSNNEIRILQLKPRVGWLPWGPVVDNFTQDRSQICLPRSPEEMLQEETAPFRSGFSYISGVTRDEGSSIIITDPFLKSINYRFTTDVFDRKVRDFMRMYNYSVNAHAIRSAITFMYSPPIDPRNTTLLRQGYIDLLSDRNYKAPSFKMGELLAEKRVPTYMFVLNYTFEGYKPYRSWEGVSSETEHLLMSGAPFMNPKYYPSNLNLNQAKWTEGDRNMSSFYLQAWVNFAKFGKPTPTRLFNTILWDPIVEGNIAYLNLNCTNVTSTMIWNYRQRESEFWNCYLPFLIDREPPTPIPTLEPGTEELRVLTGALWGTVATATIFFIVTLVCCILFYRARKYDSY